MRKLLRCLALFAAVAPAGYSDVIYAFLGAARDDGDAGRTINSFVLVVLDFLKFSSPNQFRDFSCSQLASSFNCRDNPPFTGVSFNLLAGDSIVSFNGRGYLFANDVFSAVGAYQTINYGDPDSDSGSLQVQLQPSAVTVDPTVVPEPRPVWLMLPIAAAIAFRQRRATAISSAA